MWEEDGMKSKSESAKQSRPHLVELSQAVARARARLAASKPSRDRRVLSR